MKTSSLTNFSGRTQAREPSAKPDIVRFTISQENGAWRWDLSENGMRVGCGAFRSKFECVIDLMQALTKSLT